MERNNLPKERTFPAQESFCMSNQSTVLVDTQRGDTQSGMRAGRQYQIFYFYLVFTIYYFVCCNVHVIYKLLSAYWECGLKLFY